MHAQLLQTRYAIGVPQAEWTSKFVVPQVDLSVSGRLEQMLPLLAEQRLGL